MQPFSARALIAPGLAVLVGLWTAPASADPGAASAPRIAGAEPPPTSGPHDDQAGQEASAPAASPAGRPAPGVFPAASTGQDTPQPFSIGAAPAWFLLGGLSAGATVADVDSRGGYVGGELSLVRLLSGRTIGAYADAYYDFGADGTYASAGVELGWKVLAIDGGVATRLADENALGGTVRLCATVGLFALCGRYSRFDADDDRNVVQLGALLKLPLMSPWGGYR